MSSKATPAKLGSGSPDDDLSRSELRAVVEHSLMQIAPGARVLAIIPDKTRDDNTDVLFPFAAELLQTRQVSQFDGLVAQGTHVPMTEAEKRAKIGVVSGTLPAGSGAIFDNQWTVTDA